MRIACYLTLNLIDRRYANQLYKYVVPFCRAEMQRMWYRSWMDLAYQKARNKVSSGQQPVGVTTPAASIWISWVAVGMSIIGEFLVWGLLFGRNCQISTSNKLGLSTTSTMITTLVCPLLSTSHHSASRRSWARRSQPQCHVVCTYNGSLHLPLYYVC